MKTLKDLKYMGIENDDIKEGFDLGKNTLKEEAIKWMQEMNYLIKKNYPFNSKEIEKINIVAHHNFESGDLEGFDALDFIEHFFNITKEELIENDILLK